MESARSGTRSPTCARWPARIIDTSGLTVHEFKDRLQQAYGAQETRGALTVSLVSFGFKYGLPYDADLVFDVRFLPNPHFVAELGRSMGAIRRRPTFVLSQEETRRFMARLEDFCASCSRSTGARARPI